MKHAIKIKRLPLCALILLGLTTQQVFALGQESQDSVQHNTPTDTALQATGFDPFAYRLQKRHMEKGYDFEYKNGRWLNHLSLGVVGSGFLYGSKQTQNAGSGEPLLDKGASYGAFLQYDITRLHGLRLLYNEARFPDGSSTPSVRTRELLLGYVFNLTNYFKGYAPGRRFHTSLLLNAGLGKTRNGQENVRYVRGEVGLQFDYALLRNLSLFAEPYLSLTPDRYNLDFHPGKFEYMGGLRAGVRVRPYGWKDYADYFAAGAEGIPNPTWYQRFFFGGSVGRFKSNTTGYYDKKNWWKDYNLFLGYELGAMSNLRLMFTTKDDNESVSFRHKNNVELDYMLDLIGAFRGYQPKQRLRLFGYAGMGAKFIDQNNGKAPKGMYTYADKTAAYLTGGLSLHYYFTPQWSIFAEPWLGKEVTGQEKALMGGVRVGGQFNMINTHTYVKRFINDEQDLQAMLAWRKRPFSHLFYGGSLGFGTYSRDVYGQFGEYTHVIPMTLFAGYHFSPTQSLRLQGTYLQPTQRNNMTPKAKRLQAHLDYMLNFTNLVHSYRSDRHWTFSGFAGVGARFVETNKQTSVAPMGVVGVNVDYRLRNGMSIFLEPYTSVTYARNMPTLDFGYGVNAGLALNLENAYMYGPAVGGTPSKEWNSLFGRRLFFGAGSGYLFNRHKGRSMNYLPMMAYMGYKLTPVQSLRLRAVYAKTTDQNDRSARMSGHLDYMLNLTNLYAGYRRNRDFQIQNFIGMGIELYPSPLTGQDRKSLVATGGFNATLRIKNGLSVFAEPQIALLHNLQNDRKDLDVQGAILAGLHLDLDPIHAYHPRFGKHSEKWHPAFYERLFFGLGYGWTNFINSHMGTKPTATVMAGYYVSPIHTWRARAMFHPRTSMISPKQRVSASIDYMFSLTNMLNAYDPNRRLNLSGVLGLGLHYTEQDKKEAPRNGRLAMKLGLQATGGLNIDYRVTPSVHAFVEPFIGMNMGALSPQQHRYTLGINGGLIVKMQENKMAFKQAAQTMSHRVFYEGALGLVMPVNVPGSQNNLGYSIDGRMGLWVNSFMGLRASVAAQTYYHSPSYASMKDFRNGKPKGMASTTNLTARGEFIFNPLNLTDEGRQAANTRRFDLNVAVGLEAAVSGSSAQIGTGNDVSIPYGYTLSAQLLYRTNPYTALFLEPRFERLKTGYYKSARQVTGTDPDRLLTLQAGIRLQTPTRQQRMAFKQLDKTIFVPHSFVGARLGGYRSVGASKSVRGGRTASMFTVEYGYAATALHSAKVQFSASRYVTHANDHRYAYLDYGLLYMTNLTNMITGTQASRRINVYGEIGPMFTSMVGHTRNAPRNRHFAAGAAAGIMGTYRLNDKLSLNAEGLGQMMGARSLMPGGRQLINCLRLNLTAGVQYNF